MTSSTSSSPIQQLCEGSEPDDSPIPYFGPPIGFSALNLNHSTPRGDSITTVTGSPKANRPRCSIECRDINCSVCHPSNTPSKGPPPQGSRPQAQSPQTPTPHGFQSKPKPKPVAELEPVPLAKVDRSRTDSFYQDSPAEGEKMQSCDGLQCTMCY
ncbi:uncharacterized protein RCC_08595 [Ramularia collo-cygni]|uniref:Uncharacterized protein n=1 Tax=Ramularia collo-cygni TaxID=112498 RepID=A0A2D3VMN5_9PEZI|nr:uncharacterized protein RCC_08595 [Ramularia collo-cygni]CZT22888.1 uncharacterized protein RCC_08595 [Ramularia collo-cygni]